MAEKTLRTRIKLLYKPWSEWQAIQDTFYPLKGEVCLIEIPQGGQGSTAVPIVTAKVGQWDGVEGSASKKSFAQLDFIGGKSIDVYEWAKKETLEFSDLSDDFKSALDAHISGKVQDTNTKYRLVKTDEAGFKYQLQKKDLDDTDYSDVAGSVIEIPEFDPTEIEARLEALEDKDEELESAITAEETRAKAEEAKKVDTELVGTAGKSLIFNEKDGGGAKFEGTNGVNAYVGTHDNIGGEIGTQIYVDKANGNESTIIDVTQNGAYYTKGTILPGAQRDVPANEIATMKDIEAISIPEYTIVKDADAGDFVAKYHLTKDGINVGADINIPKDYLVKSAEIKTVEQKGVPYAEAEVGDKYIDFVINAKDGAGTESHIYLPVNDLVDTYTAGEGIIISSANEISVNTEVIATVDYVDASISDTMNYVMQEDKAEREARIAGDNLLQTAITNEETRAKAEEAKKVDKEITGDSGTATIFNERDGGGAKFVHNDGTESFVGVNDGGEAGLAAQIYADKFVDGKWKGAKLDVTNDGMYYTVGDKSFAERAVEANELATKGDISEAGAGKLDIMPGDEHTGGNAYNLPYFFYTEDQENKVVVHAKTVSLDGNKTQGDYTLDVESATENKAGLMSATDKANLDKAVLEDDVLILDCNF